MDGKTIFDIAKQELIINVRNRWTLIFAIVFGALVVSISYFGMMAEGFAGMQNFTRTSASILNLVLYLVPLVALIMGTLSFTGDKGATVQIAGETAGKFDAAVIAVPGNAVAALCPTLTERERGFFEGVRYASSIIAFVLAGPEALPPFYGAGMTCREGVRLYGMAVENAKAGVVPPGKTLFNCAFAEDLAAELMDQPDEVVTAALMTELRKLPLRGLDSIEGIVIHRWPALVPQFYPGYHKALRRFLRRSQRTDRLFFAGDYLVGPYTEAALTSGLRAADEVGERMT